MTTHAATRPEPHAPIPLRIGLWLAQALIFTSFVFFGLTKLITPISQLAAMMPWAGEVPVGFVRFLGLVDLAGGVGIMLPALTRIHPRLTVLAALGCTILQVAASAFHTYRGEFAVLPLNAVLLALSVFILWGRATKAPISPRA
jgi:hypothetical protein